MKKAKQFSVFVILFFLLWMLIHSIFITIDGLFDRTCKSDVAVVLGNKVNADGTPSNRLKSRLAKAIQLYNEGIIEMIMVSGGIDPYGNNEAQIMSKYLIENGIPASSIIEDENGYNTDLTAQNSKSIMIKNGLNSILFISQFYHISRTKLAFKKNGIQSVCAAHAEYFEARDIYSISREFPAYYYYLVFH